MASEYDSLMITLLIIAGFGGVSMNACFIFLNLSRPEFRKDYFLFLSATSFLNCVHSWVIFILQPIVIARDISGDTTFCKLLSSIHIISGVGGITFQSLLSFNRYIAMFHTNKLKIIFNRKKIFAMITTIMLIPITCGFLLWYFDDLGRPLGTLCCPMIDTMPVSHVFFVFGPMFMSYTISSFFTFKIYRLIKKHTSIETHLVSKLQEGKEIVRLIVIEIALPVCMESPVVILSFMTKALDIPMPVYDMAIFFFILHSSTDPLVAMIVIKPYRKAVSRLWKKLLNKPAEETIFTFSNRLLMKSRD